VDFKIRRGAFREGRTLPFVPGYDVSGVVREMGPAAQGFKIGDEVYASPSLIRSGANAEYASAWTPAPRRLNLPRSITPCCRALPLSPAHRLGSLAARARLEQGGDGVDSRGWWRCWARRDTTGQSSTSCRVHHRKPGRIRSFAAQLGADVIVNYAEEDFVQRVERRPAVMVVGRV
jgi:NADPH:quinone reductase-like Zn-dependent oxidoreductase